METQAHSTRNTFTIISLVLGILALISLCTAILPIPLGAASILFAVLSHRKGKQLDTLALTGVVTSIAGMAMSCVLFIMSFMMLPDLLQDDTFIDYMNDSYEAMYGVSFEEFVEESYGMGLDELFGEQ